jgi:hypothetical protein
MTAETLLTPENHGSPATKYPRLAGRTQGAVFRWIYHHPDSTLKEAAKALGITHNSAKLAISRLRRRPEFQHLCPECLHFSLFECCHNCGFEPGFDSLGMEGPSFIFSTIAEARYRLQSNGGLGSDVDYSSLRPKYGARNLQHLVDHGPEADRTLEDLKSSLWEELKGEMLSDNLTDLAARILEAELNRIRFYYPEVLRMKDFKHMMIRAVRQRMRQLAGVRVSLSPPQTSKEVIT